MVPCSTKVLSYIPGVAVRNFTVELESSTMIVGTFAIFFILCVNRGTLAAVALGKAQEHPSKYITDSIQEKKAV